MNVIRAERARFGWTRKELAQMLGVAVNTVRNWEEDVGSCKGSHLIALSNVFGGVSIDYLLGIEEERRLRR